MSEAAALPLQYLEVDDFSGGITDYYLRGDTKRAKRLDNFYITVDKKIEVRWGSVGFDQDGNHKLDRLARTDAFLLFNKETELFVTQGRSLFYLNSTPAWTELVGPSSNEALNAGAPHDAVSSSSRNDHLYLVSEGFDIPSKIYRDEEGALQVRTLGLPRPTSTPAYTDSSLLGTCIRLANNLRQQMLAHMADNNASGHLANYSMSTSTGPTYLHVNPDKHAMHFLQTQTWVASDPDLPSTATPAPDATDLASLLTLVEALSNVNNHHSNGYNASDNPSYHYPQVHGVMYLDGAQVVTTRIPARGPYKPTPNTAPTTLEEAASFLDEIRSAWCLHRLGAFLHHANNYYPAINKYPITEPAVGVVDLDGVLTVTPDYTDYFRYVNYLKHAYNFHVTNSRVGGFDYVYAGSIPHYYIFHNAPMGSNDTVYPHWVTLPDATDLDSAALIIAWVGLMYGAMHYPDGNVATHTLITADHGAGATSLTDVKYSGAAHTITLGNHNPTLISETSNITPSVAGESDRAVGGARISASGLGTATSTIAMTNSGADARFQYSQSYFHGYWVQGNGVGISSLVATLADTTTHAAGPDEAVDVAGLDWAFPNIPQSTGDWIELASEIFVALNAHAMNGRSHSAPFDLAGKFLGQTDIAAYPILNRGYNLLAYHGPFFKPEIATYVYGATFKDTYTTDLGLEHVVSSEPVFTGSLETVKVYSRNQKLSAGIDGVDDGVVSTVYGPVVSNIPTLTNTARTNYATGDVQVQVWRTVDTGNTYYLLDEYDNGETSFTDTAPDTASYGSETALDTREELYTTGGVVENTQPPVCKYLHLIEDLAYYGCVKDGGETFSNRVVQAIPGYPDGAPGDFYVDLDGGDLTGLSSARGKPIAFCYKKIFRLEGQFDERGQGQLVGECISDEIGCVSAKSIVKTEIGVFFAGNDGFYYTDGYQIIKISLDLNESYRLRTKNLEQQKRIYGAYDRLNRRIHWTMMTAYSDADCDEIYVYYLDYGVKPSGVFTTMSNGSHFRPSAVAFFNGDMIRGDERGLIFRHNPAYLSDPSIPEDLDTDLEDWATVHIPYDYTSTAMNFGTDAKGQYVTKMHFLGQNKGNFAMQPWVIADNRYNGNEGRFPLAPIRYAENPRWGDPTIDWESDLNFEFDGKADFWRMMPGRGLRSQLKQIQFVPARTGVYKYDDFPPGSYVAVDPDFGTVTLTMPDGYSALEFPPDVVGMYVAFDNDEYTQEWVILGVEGNVLTLANTIDTPPVEGPPNPPVDPPAVETGEIQVPVKFWRPIPQPHEPWVPVYTTFFTYKMAPGDFLPFWFRVRTAETVDLALGGSDAALFEATFYKPYGMNLNGTSAYLRPTLATSPLDTYYDALNPIPDGASNFTPEVPGEYEYVYCVLTCKGTTTTGDYDLQIDFGGDSLLAQVHVWDNISLPAVPYRPLVAGAFGSYAGKGPQGAYTNDTNQATAAGHLMDLLSDFRLTGHGSPTSYLSVSGGVFLINANSGTGGSFKQLIIDKLGATEPKFWFCDPMGTAAHRTLAYAQAAEATIAAQSYTNMWVYIWDEPGASDAATLKATLDNWSTGSPSTNILLTTSLSYDDGNPSGLDFSTYANLVLVPVIQQIGVGTYPAITAYGDGKAGFYSSCQGNCRARTNGANTNTGTDQLEVDHAYIDLPMHRRYAAFALAQRDTWRSKIATQLYYAANESWADYNGTATDPTKNPWLSPRRFGVLGDGTLAYPKIQNFKPHVGIAAFGASELGCVPSMRLLYLGHASRMMDMIELYRLSKSLNLGNNLCTDPDSFETDYDKYELIRQQVGDALEDGGLVDLTTTVIGTGATSPEDLQEDVAPNDPPADTSDDGPVDTVVADVYLPALEAAKWVIRGFMKEGKVAPISYVLHFAQLGERGNAYRSDQRGENA